MRPAVHNHRIIKTSSSASAASSAVSTSLDSAPSALAGKNVLLPISNAAQNIIQQHYPGGGGIGRLNENDHHHLGGKHVVSGGNSDREQINNLQRRIKELEKDNFQLNHHVQQAEQTIRNYRDLMANNLNKNYTNNDSSSTSMPPLKSQSAPASALPNNNQQLQGQLQQQASTITTLEQKIKDINQKLVDVTTQKERFQHKLDEYLPQIRERDEWKKQVEQLQQTNRLKQAEIQTLQDQILFLTQQLKQTKTPSPIKTVPSGGSLKDHTSLIVNMHQQIKNLQQEIHTLRSKVQHSTSSILDTVLMDIQQIHDRCTQSSQYWKQALQNKTSEFIVYRVEHDRIEKSLRDEIQELKQQQQHGSSMSGSLQRQVNPSPMPPRNHGTNTSNPTPDGKTYLTPIVSRKVPTNSQQTNAVIQTPVITSGPEVREVFCSPLLDWKLQELNEESLRKKIQSHEQEIIRLQKEVDIKNTNLESFTQRLQAATKALTGLQDVHNAEIKAIKHVAHIKELMRVAKEREQIIDRDRAHMEIKHLK